MTTPYFNFHKNSSYKPITSFSKTNLKKQIPFKQPIQNITFENPIKSSESTILSKSQNNSFYINLFNSSHSSKTKIIHLNPKYIPSYTKYQTPQKKKTSPRILTSPPSSNKVNILNSSNPLRYPPPPNGGDYKQRGKSFQSKTKQVICRSSNNFFKNEISEIKNKINLLEKELSGNKKEEGEEEEVRLLRKRVMELEKEKEGLYGKNNDLKEENMKLKRKLNMMMNCNLDLLKEGDGKGREWKGMNVMNREQSVEIVENYIMIEKDGKNGIIEVVESQNEYLEKRIQELENKIKLMMVIDDE